jgi:epoxyqueuosine reductase
MDYLAASLAERLDPALVLPTVRSIISLGVVYHSEAAALPRDPRPEAVRVARYALGHDYHDVVRDRLRRLLRDLAERAGEGFEAFSCVDNGPVQERVFAEQAGLGWIGKNTCVINADLGSWLFLAEILTNADLEPDAPARDQCGTCTRCLEACPTGAIVEPYVVDATRCVAYLTIERRDAVDVVDRKAIGPEVFGCDICQDVCPWNRRPATSADPAWRPRDGLVGGALVDWCARSDDEWRRLLRGSALRRAGLSRIRRSLAYAAARLDPAARRRALDALAAHPSASAAGVVEAIAWARAAL